MHQGRIANALGATARQIEHIGSTSVPGLAGKPIVDMLLTIRDITAVEDYLLLRERLRADETDRVPCENTKRQLAEQDWPDMNAYTDAKTMVIEEITARARASAQTR